MVVLNLFGPRFRNADTGREASRLYYGGRESTALELASADTGHVVATAHLQVTSTGAADEALWAIGDTTYARVDASLVGASGPWTDISAGHLLSGGAADEVLDVWVRVVALRWSPSLVNPDLRYRLRLASVGAAALTA